MKKILICFLLVLLSCNNVSANEPEPTSTAEPITTEETVVPTTAPLDEENTPAPSSPSDALPTMIPEDNDTSASSPPSTETTIPTINAQPSEPSTNDQNDDLFLQPGTYTYRNMKYTIFDLQTFLFPTTLMQTNENRAQLQREKRIARYEIINQGGYEYISKFLLDGKTGYCIEPYVLVILDGNGQGPQYTIQPSDLSSETLNKVGRIIHYGYGHPLTGSSDESYLATQLLIWQMICPTEYQEIMNSLQWCEPMDQQCPAVSGAVDVSAVMNDIMNLVDNYDTTPSFAGQWHETITYELDWDETLILTDDGSTNLHQPGIPILNWFESFPQESHAGINIKQEDNVLKIDIDDLYYEGYDSEKGKTLTFKRKDQGYQSWLNNILLYTSGNNQKLMGISFENPTPAFTLAFKLKTADIEIEKLDEYYQSQNFSAGTQFVIGWMEDPTQQYRYNGGKDPNWEELYNYQVAIDPDKYGSFNYVNSHKTYYPIMNEDGSNIRVFTVGADGKAHISDLLPQNKSWWIKEWKVSNPYLLDDRPFLVSTGSKGDTTQQKFVNMLRDINLSLIKQDSDDPYKKLNGAGFELYQLDDFVLSKDPTQLGPLTLDHLEQSPALSYQQLIANLPNPQIGQSFFLNGFHYKISKIENDAYFITCQRYDDYNANAPITFDQIPLDIKPYEKFSIDNNGKNTEYEFIQYAFGIATIKYTDKTQTITLTNVPADNLKPNAHLEHEGHAYTIKEILPENTSIIVWPATLYHITDNDALLTYDQLPEDIKYHDASTFTINNTQYEILSYDPHKIRLKAYVPYRFQATNNCAELTIDDISAWINDNMPEFTLDTIPLETSMSINGIEYRLIAKNLKDNPSPNIEVEKIQTTEFTIEVPMPISLDDVPQTIISNEAFTILDIIEPAYYVTDSDSSEIYKITSDGNYRKSQDDNYILTTDNSIIDYWELTKNKQKDPTVFCNEPYDILSCPLGTVREHTYQKIIDVPYIYAQFADIAKAAAELGRSLEQYQANESIVINEMTYTIVKPLDQENANEITVALQIDDQDIQITLKENENVTSYQYRKTFTKSYTISAIDPKEYVVRWSLSSFNDHLIHPDLTFHLKAGQDLQYALDFTYDQIPNIEELQPNDTFMINGHQYMVCANYPQLDNIVIKDENEKMFFLDPQASSCYDIISYDKVLQLEQANQKPFALADTFTLPYQRQLIKGDDLTINGKKYTLLSKSDDKDMIFGFALEDDAPFSYDQILDMFKTHSKVQIGDDTYILKKDAINDEEATIVQDQNGNTYHYYRYHLINHQDDNGLEQGFWINKPSSISYQEVLRIFANKLPALQTSFIYDNKVYQLTAKNQRSLTLKDLTSTTAQAIEAHYDQDADRLTLDKYFISLDKIYDLKTIFNNNDQKSYITCSDPAIIIDGNLIKASTMKTFDIQLHYGQDTDGLTYEAIKKALGKTPIKGDTFNFEGKKYTINDIKMQNDVNEALIVKRTNVLDPKIYNTYEIPITVPITKKDIPPISSDLHDTFTKDGITYTIEEIIKHEDNTKDFKVSFFDANNQKCYYLLTNQQLSSDPKIGSIIQIYDFTTTNEDHSTIQKITVLPIFKGETGKNHLLISDPANHQSPISFYPVIISKDPDGIEIVKSGYSDHWGMFPVDDLAPGTYFYNQPNAHVMKEFTVFAHEQIEGQLNINDLKWGKSYMACETQLPLGYDYSEANIADAKDICFTFNARYDEDISSTYENVLNTKRKLDLEVIKVDHDDQNLLLNGAIFTISDVTNLNHDASNDDASTFPNKITFQDIPEDITINKRFSLWPDDTSQTFSYEIIEIAKSHIKVKCLDDQMTYHVTKDKINVNVPLTYQDIIKNCSPLKIGARFKAYGKQQGNIQTYQVIDISYIQDPAIWQPEESEITSAITITGYKLIDINDNNKQIIEVKNDMITMPEIISEQQLGTYVSGGIYQKLTINQAVEPFIFSDVMAIVANPVQDLIFELAAIEQIQAPAYDDIPQSLKSSEKFKFNAADFTIIAKNEQQATISYATKENKIAELTLTKDDPQKIFIQALINDRYQIKEIITDYFGIRYEDIPDIDKLKPNDIITINDICYKVIANDLIKHSISLQNASSETNEAMIYEGPIETFYANQDHNEKILTMTVKNLRTNKTYHLYDGQTYTYQDIASAGEKYFVTSAAQDTILEGYTNEQGEIIIYGLPEGEYQLHYREMIEAFTIKHGRFSLKDLDYGTKLKICEIHSPLGYIIGNACEIITIANDNDTLVKNFKTNQKLVVDKKKKIVRIRKMGQE